MEYLIIGGCGFIGTNLTKKLLDEGKKVTVIDNLSRKGTKKLKKLFLNKKNYSFFKIDISNREKI
jgi:CDP-paratose 2-epimerase